MAKLLVNAHSFNSARCSPLVGENLILRCVGDKSSYWEPNNYFAAILILSMLNGLFLLDPKTVIPEELFVGTFSTELLVLTICSEELSSIKSCSQDIKPIIKTAKK